MKILLTNDDGFKASGLKALKSSIDDLGKVISIAPDRERSASGHSASFYRKMICRKIEDDGNYVAFTLNGTPVDCILIGLQAFLPKGKPDLILAGINAGSNMGRDIFYSGTVAAAREGYFHRISSIALSMDGENNFKYYSASKVIKKLIRLMPQKLLENPISLNINFPNIEFDQMKGMKLTNPGHVFHTKKIKKIKKSRQLNYYWIEGSKTDGLMKKNTDYWAIRNQYISMTIISDDKIDTALEEYVKDWIQSFNRSLALSGR